MRRANGRNAGARNQLPGWPAALAVALSVTLAVAILAGGALYLRLPAFRRRVDYAPIKIRALLLEQQRRRHPPTVPPPAATWVAIEPGAQVQPTLTAATRAPPTPVRQAQPPTPTPQPSLTPTHVAVVPTPTDEPTPRPTPTMTPSATPTPTRSAVYLEGAQHVWQDYNNCGPATFAMALSYYGRTDTQQDVQRAVRPNKWDLNVSPHELAAYVRSTGLEVLVREGGTIDLLKRFLDRGIPVVLELWYYPDEHGGGHFRLVLGYDEAAGELIAHDVHWGPDYRVPYEQQDQEWQVFNRLYVVIYRPEQADLVHEILGAEMDDAVMYRQALQVAMAERDADPGNAFAWFNVGTNYTALGDHASAVSAFDQARVLGLPFRTLWYQFGPYEAYLAVERYQDVIDLATATLQTVGNQEESHYYLGRAWQALGDVDAARACYLRALHYHPGFAPAVEALDSLD